MYQHIRAFHLFECRSKRSNEIGREITNEADGVIDNYFLIARQAQAPARRIKSREHSVFGRNRRSSQSIQQSGLARVCVADYRDYWEIAARTTRTLNLAARANLFYLFFEQVYPIANSASIDFELCFARTSSSDSTH